MSRKVEIRTRIGELHKEFAALNAEVKALDEAEKRAANAAKFQDYKFKVGMHDRNLSEEDNIKDVTDADREIAQVGLSGLVYTDTTHTDGFCYIMLKDREQYGRAQRILTLLDAVENLKDEKQKDKEKYLKILLGESDAD